MSGLIILIVVLFFLCYAVLLFYYRSGWLQLEEITTDKHHDPKTKVTIIIPARNEEEHIGHVLKDILSQYYPTHLMEVIVVDDHSEDRTAEIVSEYKGVKLIHLAQIIGTEKLNAYKKKAIEAAIKESSGDLIVTTDADCRFKPYWLLSIVSFYEKHKVQFIAAPVSMTYKNLGFEYFQALDFTTMQGITGALSFFQNGAMCNGANLAYTRNAFVAVNGFKDIDSIASGDDMLLMYKIEKKFPKQTRYLKNKEAIAETPALDSFHAFLQQRILWASKANHFADKRIQWVLYLVYFFNALFPLLLLLGLFWNALFATFWVLLLSKTYIEGLFLFPVCDFFSKPKNWLRFFLFQFLHIPYILISGFLGQSGSYQWKNRQVK